MYTGEVFLFSVIRCFEIFFPSDWTSAINTPLKEKNLNECRRPENHRTVDVGKWKIKPELLETRNRKGSLQNGMANIKISSSVLSCFQVSIEKLHKPQDHGQSHQ